MPSEYYRSARFFVLPTFSLKPNLTSRRQRVDFYELVNDVLFMIFCVGRVLRACSYDPACRDVSPSGEDISVRSYGVFHPACRDEILLLALAKHVHFSHATQRFNDFCVFLYLFARKSIALARYLILLYSTNKKLSKKC